MFKNSNMSPAEALFIRTYIAVLRRRYFDLQAALYLMHPENLSVANFVDATRIVTELNAQHEDFERKLQVIRLNRGLQSVNVPPDPAPSADQLADMVMLSFFKVVGVVNDASGFTPSAGQGWFSGKPNEWRAFLTNLLKTQPDVQAKFADDLVTQCMQAIAKLFHKSSPLKKKLYPPPAWPKSDAYLVDDDFDEYFDDEPDSPENPFWA